MSQLKLSLNWYPNHLSNTDPYVYRYRAWNSKSRQIYHKSFDTRNSHSPAVQIIHHDCDITTESVLSVHRDLKSKTVNFMINGKEQSVSFSGNGPDFCFGFARLCSEDNDSKIKVTLVPKEEEEEEEEEEEGTQTVN